MVLTQKSGINLGSNKHFELLGTCEGRISFPMTYQTLFQNWCVWPPLHPSNIKINPPVGLWSIHLK